MWVVVSALNSGDRGGHRPVASGHDLDEVDGQRVADLGTLDGDRTVTGFSNGNVQTWLGRSDTPCTLPPKASSMVSSTTDPGLTVNRGPFRRRRRRTGRASGSGCGPPASCSGLRPLVDLLDGREARTPSRCDQSHQYDGADPQPHEPASLGRDLSIDHAVEQDREADRGRDPVAPPVTALVPHHVVDDDRHVQDQEGRVAPKLTSVFNRVIPWSREAM